MSAKYAVVVGIKDGSYTVGIGGRARLYIPIVALPFEKLEVCHLRRNFKTMLDHHMLVIE